MLDIKIITKKYQIKAMSRAMSLSEIPPEFKHMKVIGRGNTSIVLEKDADTVVMFTRDGMKKDWLSGLASVQTGRCMTS